MNAWGIPFLISLVLHLGLLSMVSFLSPDIKNNQLKPILVKVSKLPVHVEAKREPILNPPAKLPPPPPKVEEPPQEMKKIPPLPKVEEPPPPPKVEEPPQVKKEPPPPPKVEEPLPPPPKVEAKVPPKEIKKPPTEDIEPPKPLPVAEKEITLNETEKEPIIPDFLPPDLKDNKKEEIENIQASVYTGNDKSSLSPEGVGNEPRSSTEGGEDGLGEGPGKGKGPKKGKGFPGWLKGTGPGIDFGDHINSSNKNIGRRGGGGDKDNIHLGGDKNKINLGGDKGNINLGGDKGNKKFRANLGDRERKGTGPSVNPRYSENPKPLYPDEARKQGNEGTVLLLVEVLPNGRVGEIEVEKTSGHELLDQSALTTVKRWLFIPAKKGGTPFTCRVRIPIVFKLQ